MQERHKDRRRYFKEQGLTTKKFVIPYIEEVKEINAEKRILEIGCGEGGNMAPFIELGCEVVGVDLNGPQLERAQMYIDEDYPGANVRLMHQNIYDITAEEIGHFDIVMLRDVIEHIPDQGKFLQHLKSFLQPEGVVFFGFPPWWMPFGGHQQVCESKFLSKLPYFHLFPTPIYKLILQAFGEKEGRIDSLIEIKETGIGISRFQNLVRKNGYTFLKKTYYVINPNYETKFGLKPREQNGLVGSIPYLRDLVTTCMYSVIRN